MASDDSFAILSGDAVAQLAIGPSTFSVEERLARLEALAHPAVAIEPIVQEIVARLLNASSAYAPSSTREG